MIDYDPHDWYSHLFDIKGSMVKEILGRVGLCVLWSAFVVLLNTRMPSLSIPLSLHSLVGFALGLLLVFRTNASYDRFWEGRKLWGGIVNSTRNLARGLKTLLARESATQRDAIRWVQAFPYAAMSVLKKRKTLGTPASKLPEGEVERVLASDHLALAVAARLSALINNARQRGLFDENLQAMLDRPLAELIDHIGGCERIHKTPLPFPYMVHLRRALLLYCYTLPFALVRDFGWVTILDTLLVTYIFFGIEEIGVEIEDPFGDDENDLPLEQFCAGIEAVLEDLLNAPMWDARALDRVELASETSASR